MPTRLCANPACPQPATYRGRCADHSRGHEQTVNRAGHALYRTKRWQQTREAVLAQQPLCPCGEIAEHVHHIRDIADGGDPWAQANLQALCASCHSRETRARQHA